MNREVYQTFKKELIKESSISGTIGTGIGKVLELAWDNPKTTMTLAAAGITIPYLLNKLLREMSKLPASPPRSNRDIIFFGDL